LGCRVRRWRSRPDGDPGSSRARRTCPGAPGRTRLIVGCPGASGRREAAPLAQGPGSAGQRDQGQERPDDDPSHRADTRRLGGERGRAVGHDWNASSSALPTSVGSGPGPSEESAASAASRTKPPVVAQVFPAFGHFQTVAVHVRRLCGRSTAVNPRSKMIRSMFGGATAGDAAGMDAAVITIFVVAVVLVGMIALREFGRKR
jgi:hypothetical protein